MDKEFFERKIRELSDDKLRDLLKLGYEANRDIVDLAIDEAKKRDLELPDISVSGDDATVEELSDRKKLEKWNWGAFLLAPFWTLANKLEKWTILTFIPGVNLLAVIYLGRYGNRLAYDKSDIRNIEHFMVLQGQWNKWAIRIFWLVIAASIVGLFIP